MTEIIFHVVNLKSEQACLQFACRLLEKMYSEQKQTYVHLSSQQEAVHFDHLLWTYREDSFVPHELYSETEKNPCLIQIGYHLNPITSAPILLNLSKEIPSFYPQFKEMIEIVFKDPLMQQLARERYKYYREKGFAIRTIKDD